jgi:hypothetical protein
MGIQGAEVRGGCTKVHSEMHHDFYVSLDIIQVDVSRRMRWAKHVERMGEKCTSCFGGTT